MHERCYGGREMTKIKDFFKHIVKKFKQNWRKILLWSVLLVFAVCGMVYSWTRKNKAEIVSGSADTSYENYVFSSSNLVTSNYRYSGVYSDTILRGVNTLSTVNLSISRFEGAFSIMLSDISDSVTGYTPNTSTIDFDGDRVVSGYIELYRNDFNSTPPLSPLGAVYGQNVGISSQFMRWWYDIGIGDYSGKVIRLNMFSTKIDGMSLNGIQCYYNVFQYIFDTGGYVSIKALVIASGATSNLLFTNRSYFFGDFSQDFQNGYEQGLIDGENNKQDAVNEAYTNGKNAGYNLAMETLNNNGAPTFLSLIDAVGYGVTKPFVSLLNFDLLGVNMLDFATSILTIFIVVKIITLFV